MSSPNSNPARPVVPPRLENTFNKMYLLTSNLLPNNFIPVAGKIGLTAQQDNLRAIAAIDAYIITLFQGQNLQVHADHKAILKEAYKHRLNSYSSYNSSGAARKNCIEYDLKSFNGDPSGLTEDAMISQIAKEFYEIVLRVHCYNLYCILVLKKQLETTTDKAKGVVLPDPIGGVLFMNPLFNAYDATFPAPDGTHDAEPRGDMAGTEIKQQRGNGPPKGGWKALEKIMPMGNNQKDNLLLAIRSSSVSPTVEQSDDICIEIGQRWPSLTALAGHRLLEPTNFERLICNIVMPERVVLSSSDFLANSGNRYKIVEVKDSTDGVEKTRENVRKVYGFDSLNNNFAISDCSGPRPSELHSLIGSSNIVPGIDDVEEEEGDDTGEEEQEGGGPKTKQYSKAPKPKKKSQSEKRKEKRGRVGTITSGLLDSSSDKSQILFETLKKVIPQTTDFKDYVTFLLPHTRWPFEIKVKGNPATGQIFHIMQRIVINFSETIPIFQLRFEAWCTEALPGVNASQTVPTKFLSASKFFKLEDKSPGVNEIIRYILAYVAGTGVKDLEKKYAQQMYSEKGAIGKFTEKAEKSKIFLDKFLNALDDVLSQIPTNLKQYLGNITLLKMAVLFRHKTQGDNVRLADTAYLNELLWYSQNKIGIAIEGTCDGFSGYKAMAANNNPIILCGANKWGTSYQMYSSFTLDSADAERAALLQKHVMYVEKTQKLKTTLERLRIDFYKLKTFKLDEIAATVFLNMQQVFIENGEGEEYLERVVVGEINKLNMIIIQNRDILNDIPDDKKNRQNTSGPNYFIDNSNIAIREITQIVEASLSIIGLGLLMNTFVQNWFAYCEQFLDMWTPEIDDLIDEIDEDKLDDAGVEKNNHVVNKCISLIPSTEEMDRIKVFYDVCDKTMPNWSDPETLIKLTAGLLTLTVKKNFELAETKLKKLFDKGIPSLLCQNKDTTASYVSLTKYRDALVSLENMFGSLNPGIIPGEIGPLPQIDMVFSSGILNRIAEEQMILWVKQNGYIEIQPPPGGEKDEKIKTDQEKEDEKEEKKLDAVLKPPPTLEEQAKEEEEPAPTLEEQAQEEEEEQAKLEIKIKPTTKTPTSILNKVLSAATTVSKFKFLTSTKSTKSTKSSVVPEKGGSVQRGGDNFQVILSNVEDLVFEETKTKDPAVEGYLPEDLSIYLPVLYPIDFKDEGDKKDEDPVVVEFKKKFYEELSKTPERVPQKPEGWESYVDPEVPNEVLTSCLGDIQESLDSLLVAMDSAGELKEKQIDNEDTPNAMVNGINKLNNGLVLEGISSIDQFLDKLKSEGDDYLKQNIDHLKDFLESKKKEDSTSKKSKSELVDEDKGEGESEGEAKMSGDEDAASGDEDDVNALAGLFGELQPPSSGIGKATPGILPLSDASNLSAQQITQRKQDLEQLQKTENERIFTETNNKNSKYALVGLMLKFKSLQGVNLDYKNAVSLCHTFDRFLLQTYSESSEESSSEVSMGSQDTKVKTFKEALQLKVEILFSTLIGKEGENTLFGKLFKEKILALFFKYSSDYGDNILRNRLIQFVVQDSYGIDINLDDLIEDKGYRNILELLSVCALLYNDDLLRSAVTELYFYDSGTALQFLPAIKSGAPTPTREVEASQQDDGYSSEEKEREITIKKFYEDYYAALPSVGGTKLGPTDFPIPVKENTLPYLLLSLFNQGQRTPLVKDANVESSFKFADVCEESVLRPVVEYFWRDCCSDTVKASIRDSVKFTLIMRGENVNEKNIVELLSRNLYCYLFGTCKTARAHNGIIMDDVPGAIIELGLHQYTKPANPYLSYSVAELQSIIQQFMSLQQYKTLITPVNSARESLNKNLKQQRQLELQLEQLQLGDEMSPDERRNGIIRDLATIQRTISQLRKQIDGDKKTRNGWIAWANSIHQSNQVEVQLPGRAEVQLSGRVAVQLPGRPEDTTIDLMTTFMNDVVGGVVANYKYFSKRQREELGIDGLAKSKELTDAEKTAIREKPRTLMEFYNIVLYLVALENIENINVAKVSLLSEKLGDYLSEPQELFDDINSGLELNEPGVSFYTFFMSLFLTLPKEKVAEVALEADAASPEVEMVSEDEAEEEEGEEEIEKGFTDKRKQALVEIVNRLIDNYYANRDIKRELQRMVRDNQEVMSVIEGIIKDEEKEKEEGEVVESNTLFQMTIDDSNQVKYVKFLKSLLPPKLESAPTPSPSPSPGSSPRFPPGGPLPGGPPSDSDDDDDNNKPDSSPPSAATTPRGKRDYSGEPKPPADSAPSPLMPSPATTPRDSGEPKEEEKGKKKKEKRKLYPPGDGPGIKRPPKKDDDDNDDGPPQGDGVAGPIDQTGKKRLFTKTVIEEGDAKKPKPSEIVSDSSEKKRSSLEGSEASESKKGRIEEEGNEIPRSLKKGRAEGAAAEEGEREVVTTAKIQKRDDDEDKSEGNKIVYDNGKVRKTKRNPGGGSSKRTRKHKKR